MVFKIRATDIGPAEAKMKRGKPTPTTIKIPVSTNEIARVREGDEKKKLLEAIDKFYGREDVEGDIGTPSGEEFDNIIKGKIMDILGEKITCKVNIADPRTQISAIKSYSVTLLKWTIPVLKYFYRPLDFPEKDKPVNSITIDLMNKPKKKKSNPVKPLIIGDLINCSKIMKPMDVDLPTRSLAEELHKDAETKKLLASHGMDKFLTFGKNEAGKEIAGEISLENGDWKEIKEEELIDAKMAILFVKFERAPV